MRKVHDHVRTEIARAQAIHQEQANRSREPTPNFAPGDKVWLETEHLRTERPSKKLDHKRVGPFPILDKVGTHAYRLRLPETMKVHNVFHVSRLTFAREDPYPGQVAPPPPPVVVEGEDEYVVEEVVDSRWRGRGRNRKLQYKVKWQGYEELTWEPAENLEEVAAVDRFHLLRPGKPGPRDRVTEEVDGEPVGDDGPEGGLLSRAPTPRGTYHPEGSPMAWGLQHLGTRFRVDGWEEEDEAWESGSEGYGEAWSPSHMAYI